MSTPLLLAAYIFFISELVYCQPAVRRQCQQCERVKKPEDCLRRIRCAPGEICFTERYVTDQGHVFYDLGCKLQTTCSVTSYYVSKAELDQRAKSSAATSPHGIGRRQDNGGPMAAHICEECCDFDHCNDLLCGGHESRGIKCLNCPDMEDMGNCEMIRACPGNEMCFLEERISDKFELLFSSGCMREVQCRAFLQAKQNGGGLFDPCFKCCNETFCNVACEGPTTQPPTTVNSAGSTGPGPKPASASTQVSTGGPTPPPMTMATKTTGAPPFIPPTPANTPPPVAGRDLDE